MEQLKNKKIILEAITGSKAYGLDTPDSDTDYKGVHVASTKHLLSLNKVHNIKEVIDGHEPYDYSYYEVGKFVDLALKNNPTIMEILFLEEYIKLTEEGQMLVSVKESFLSQNVYNTYGKYALSQAHKLESHPDFTRYSKHARHCFRLLQQGREILEHGTLTVKVNNREELFEIGNLPSPQLLERFKKEYDRFMDIKTSLPLEPDYDKINNILLKIRYMNP